MDTYEQRIIGYVDIFGWSKSCEDPLQFPQLREAAETISRHAQNFSEQVKDALRNAQGVPPLILEQHATIEFSFFSDNFMVSAPIEHAEIIFKIFAISSHHLLLHSFSVRGAVTFGNLYHNKGVIFGPALIEAVKLEKDARYPRLLCSPSLINKLQSASYKNNLIFCDHFDDWIVNTAVGNSIALDNIAEIISDNLKRNKADEDITKKWEYLQIVLPRMYAQRG